MIDKSKIKSPITMNITYQSPIEEYLTTPLVLPAGEPTTPQCNLTLLQSYFPTFDIQPFSVKYSAFVVCGGKNNEATARTASYRALKNSSSIATGTVTSVVAGQYWTQSYYNFLDVVAGDILGLKYWSASSTNVNLDYKALIILPTRIQLAPDSTVMIMNLEATISNNPLSLTLGVPQLISTDALYINTSATISNGSQLITNDTVKATCGNDTNKNISIYRGDVSQSQASISNATYRPRYYSQYVPTKLVFTPTNLRIA